MGIKVTGLDDLVRGTNGYSGKLTVHIPATDSGSEFSVAIPINNSDRYENAIDLALIEAENFLGKLRSLVSKERDRLKR